MLLYPPSRPEIAAMVLSGSLFLFSLSTVIFILVFHLHSSRGYVIRPRRRLRDLNSLWTVRILLVAFVCLWTMAQFLRFRFLFPFWAHLDLCRAHVYLAQGFAEPCIFTTLLFLLRISVYGKVSCPNAFSLALVLALVSSLPLLLLHFIFMALNPWFFSPLGISPEVFFGRGMTNFSQGVRCSYPLFSTAILGLFGMVYVPCFVHACWRAAEVVINKRLMSRLYLLTGVVVGGISVQVVALSLSAFFRPVSPMFQCLRFAAFFGVFFAAVFGQGVLVLYPIADALDAVPTPRLVPGSPLAPG